MDKRIDLERFAARCRAAGARATVVPDRAATARLDMGFAEIETDQLTVLVWANGGYTLATAADGTIALLDSVETAVMGLLAGERAARPIAEIAA